MGHGRGAWRVIEGDRLETGERHQEREHVRCLVHRRGAELAQNLGRTFGLELAVDLFTAGPSDHEFLGLLLFVLVRKFGDAKVLLQIFTKAEAEGVLDRRQPSSYELVDFLHDLDEVAGLRDFSRPVGLAAIPVDADLRGHLCALQPDGFGNLKAETRLFAQVPKT